MHTKTLKIISEPDVAEVTGLSTTTRWRLERDGSFPKKIHLSKNRVGWYEHEIQNWLEAKRENAQ